VRLTAGKEGKTVPFTRRATLAPHEASCRIGRLAGVIGA